MVMTSQWSLDFLVCILDIQLVLYQIYQVLKGSGVAQFVVPWLVVL
jgi:hypothetical protein